MLGRAFELCATVIRGEGVGASIGFPTANLLVENELIPASGVYATRMTLGRTRYESVTNIGMRPTFGGKRLTVETHLLNFKKSIYGKKIRLAFLKKIREEMMFPHVEGLVQQIQKDIEAAKKILRQ
jgi:riboflavin kinase/FMN adenylyltransferase